MPLHYADDIMPYAAYADALRALWFTPLLRCAITALYATITLLPPCDNAATLMLILCYAIHSIRRHGRYYGAALLFFRYYAFDAVSPLRDMPG